MGKRLQILGQDFLKYSYSHSVEGQKVNESKIAQGDGRRCWGWAGTGDNRSCEYFMMMNPSFGTCIISATMTQLYRAVNTRHVNSRDGSLFLCSYSLFLVIASNCFAWILFYQISVQTGLDPSVCILLPPSCRDSLFPGPLISWEADEIIGGCDVLLSGVCSYPSHHNQWSCW